MAITNALGLELPQEDDNLENGLIDTKMLQKYRPLLGTLFAAQPLTY